MDNIQSSYKEKRQAWIDKDVNGGVEIPKFMQKRSEELKKHTYTASKGTMAKAQQKQNKLHLKPKVKRILKVIGVTGLMTVATIGPVTRYNSYADITPDGEIATVEQIKNNPEILEKIATEPSSIEKWKNYKKALENEEISNSELIALSEDIYNLELDVFKEKTSLATGIDKDDIETSLSNSSGEQRIQINKNETPEYSYQKGDLVETVLQSWTHYLGLDDKAMSEDLADYITSISDIQTVKNNINTSDISRDELKEKYSNALDKIEDMLSKEFVLDGKVLKTKAIEKSELSHNTQEKETDEMEL